VSHHFGKWAAKQFREAAINGEDFSLKRERQQKIVKGIDKIAIAALRALHDFEELLHLPRSGRLGLMREVVDQSAQLGHFAPSRNRIGTKKTDQQNQAEWKSVQFPREQMDGLPGDKSQSHSERNEQDYRKQPQAAFASR
jgi:hypothetical protein